MIWESKKHRNFSISDRFADYFLSTPRILNPTPPRLPYSPANKSQVESSVKCLLTWKITWSDVRSQGKLKAFQKVLTNGWTKKKMLSWSPYFLPCISTSSNFFPKRVALSNAVLKRREASGMKSFHANKVKLRNTIFGDWCC